ncbi:unnamed protein product [Pneumocystis jirovecii]|uniref:DNA-directed RNA polymerases I, II, and III subunit RPABC2 n=2 Tax=Pneumocystis jirovecii TaxID=42068 RepID=L0PAZ1_PNEJI|nr:DNA-directed RNA polymerase core subunit RPO26 [Pneumocystis jirovecii RU7]KTW31087.1 hypothetical protein T551_01639 [Pneumocystis jirovecii RU7]CCJ29538.1 unnamed protein product [Pneumocystis jirovecii]
MSDYGDDGNRYDFDEPVLDEDELLPLPDDEIIEDDNINGLNEEVAGVPGSFGGSGVQDVDMITIGDSRPRFSRNRGKGKAVAPENRMTTPYMTKYEKARILGTRSLQISMNAPVLVDLEGETDPLQIAMKELSQKKIPLLVRRYLPDGSYEDWAVSELITE